MVHNIGCEPIGRKDGMWNASGESFGLVESESRQGSWSGFKIVSCLCLMGRQPSMFGNEYLICGGWRHPPHPTAGGGTLPGPLE
ncbi:MAG: hypothetical protein PVF83_12570 [Anaerolineales bacterium]